MASIGVDELGQQPMKLETSTPPTSERLSTAQIAKTAQILDACRFNDIDTLRALAVSEDGLVSDSLRQQAWPILLGGTITEDEKLADEKLQGDRRESWRELLRHRDEDQVQLDVNRSFIYYPSDQSPKELESRKQELSDLIIEILRRQPYLCYFQGYHDICQVCLLVLHPTQRAETVARLSILRIRDFMLPTLAPALAQLRLIPAIIYTVNPKLYFHLSQTQPFFALSGTLTMYAHDIQEYGDIARLFDVLLAREAIFSVYMFAQIVLQRSDELFDTPADEPEMLHSILSKLPRPLDLEKLISNTMKLFELHPPETLRGWRSISNNSVLKTARWPDQTVRQSLEDGHEYFRKHVREVELAEQREKLIAVLWKYRKQASVVGGAIFVGLLSYYLRKWQWSSLLFSAYRR